jgi:C-terminal processing protease CtpA/Prc
MRNGPGHDDVTAPATQYVQPRGSRSFRGPVMLLTNKRVYSAAEDFALAMRQLPNVTIMGDTTAGSSGRPVTRELPNGWTYTISTWIEYDLDHRPIEGAGIAPATVVRPTRAELSAGNDVVFTTARARARIAQ